jgi:hypothetical protein
MFRDEITWPSDSQPARELEQQTRQFDKGTKAKDTVGLRLHPKEVTVSVAMGRCCLYNCISVLRWYFSARMLLVSVISKAINSLRRPSPCRADYHKSKIGWEEQASVKTDGRAHDGANSLGGDASHSLRLSRNHARSCRKLDTLRGNASQSSSKHYTAKDGDVKLRYCGT